MTAPLLDVRDLSVEFPLRRQRLQALDGISFTLEAGEVLGFVGAVSYTHLTLPTKA